MFGPKLILTLIFINALFAAGVRDSASAGASTRPGAIKPAADSLCTGGERVVWSCQMVKERKLASVCSSQDLDRTRGYVQYRFGRPGRVELEFPRERVGSQSAFKYSRYTRPLVTYLKLQFVNSGFTYTISDDSDSEQKPERRDARITITPAGANARETSMRCRRPVTGSLMKLEDIVERED